MKKLKTILKIFLLITLIIFIIFMVKINTSFGAVTGNPAALAYDYELPIFAESYVNQFLDSPVGAFVGKKLNSLGNGSGVTDAQRIKNYHNAACFEHIAGNTINAKPYHILNSLDVYWNEATQSYNTYITSKTKTTVSSVSVNQLLLLLYAMEHNLYYLPQIIHSSVGYKQAIYDYLSWIVDDPNIDNIFQKQDVRDVKDTMENLMQQIETNNYAATNMSQEYGYRAATRNNDKPKTESNNSIGVFNIDYGGKPFDYIYIYGDGTLLNNSATFYHVHKKTKYEVIDELERKLFNIYKQYGDQVEIPEYHGGSHMGEINDEALRRAAKRAAEQKYEEIKDTLNAGNTAKITIKKKSKSNNTNYGYDRYGRDQENTENNDIEIEINPIAKIQIVNGQDNFLPSNTDFHIEAEGINFKNYGNIKVIFSQKVLTRFRARVLLLGSTEQKQQMYCFGLRKENPKITQLEYTINNYGSITINKTDEGSKGAIQGVQFKLKRASNGAWYGPYTTNASGTVKIEKLPFDTYNVYETSIPGGYDLSHQGTVSSNGVNRGSVNLKKSSSDANVNYPITNTKKVIISGFVWEQTPVTKQNTVDGSIFANGMNKIGGVTVKLKNKNGTTIDTATTGDGKNGTILGEYKFTKYVAENKLKDYYVEFDYSKAGGGKYKQYIPVAFNSSSANGSRALVQTMPTASTPLKPDSDAALSGIATTYKGSTAEATYGLSGAIKTNFIKRNDRNTADELRYINLGLKTINEVDYTVSQNIEYIKIVMNGYTYKYNYGTAGKAPTLTATQKANIYSPTVNWQSQNNIAAYTRPIYPSDIKYNVESAGKLKVYVVYRIDITNTTNYKLEYLYNEQKLHITKLTNTFDTDRYQIEGSYDFNNSNNVNKDFNKWTGSGGTVEYKGDQFNGGILPNAHKTAYIQFKVNDNAIKQILDHPNGIVEKKPTTSNVDAFHEFQRKDYSWDLNIGGTAYKTHTTKNDHRETSAPYLIFKLGEERTLTGKVFKDGVVTNNGEKLGNGKYDSGEKGIENVMVELVDKSKDDTIIEDTKNLKVSTIYPNTNYNKNSDGKITSNGSSGITPNPTEARTLTNDKGEYAITGIVPGEYYLRFTYGDGTQRLTDVNGQPIKTFDGKEITIASKTTDNKAITALDYKSTIITSQAAKKASQNNMNDSDVSKEDEFVGSGTGNNKKRNYIWYKNLDVGLDEKLSKEEKEKEKLNYSVAVDSLAVRKQINDAVKEKAVTEAKATVSSESSSGETGTSTSGGTGNSSSAENINAVAGTPRISITIENTPATSADETEATQGKGLTGFKANTFGGMNLGIIEQPRQSIKIDKLLTKTKVTNSQGNMIINGNPATDTMQGVSDLTTPKSEDGSKYTKVELPEEEIYGATMELTYDIKVSNISALNYYNENYYKYGVKDNNKEVTITIDTIKDSLDEALTFMENQGSTRSLTEVQNIIERDNNTNKRFKIIKSGKIDKLYTSNGTHTEKETQTTYRVVAQKILSTQDEDMEFINHAEVPLVYEEGKSNVNNTPSKEDTDSNSQEQIDKTIISTIDGLDNKSSATITIVPPTGADLKTISIYAGITALALVVLSAGIIVVKKKILK